MDGEEIQPLGHEYETTVTAATCTTAGFEETTCSRCGDTHRTVLPTRGEHQWKEYPEVKATCSTAGHSEYTQCTVCGEYKEGKKPQTYAANGQHSWVQDQNLYAALSAAEKQTKSGNVVPLTECNKDYGLNKAFEKCTECGIHRIVKTEGGHHWGAEDTCSFKSAAYNSEQDQAKKENIHINGHTVNESIKVHHFIQSTAFLVEKGKAVNGVSNSVFRAPFEVLVNGKVYNCYILMRRSDTNPFKTFAPVVCNGDPQVKWRRVVNPDGSLEADEANEKPFYMADGYIYMACFE